jgi:hypothetical protein
VKVKHLKEALERLGPNQTVEVDAEVETSRTINGNRYFNVKIPDRLALYCSSCKGERGFTSGTEQVEVTERWRTDKFLTFKCKDCESVHKTYAVHLRQTSEKRVTIGKYGEVPPFGASYDPRIGALLGADDHLYRKGLDCESAGMGIGAFAYYRRLVENQRISIFEKVISVAERLKAPVDVLDGLRKARDDRQFTKAIASIKAGPLQAIYINGHNPLTLLYDAVSDGLHGQSDAENLEAAQTIRLLLADLAKRLEETMADHKEVELAVTRLLQAQAKRRSPERNGG